MARTYKCSHCSFLFDRPRLFKSKQTARYYCIDVDQCDRRCRNDLTFEELLSLGDDALQQLKGH